LHESCGRATAFRGWQVIAKAGLRVRITAGVPAVAAAEA